MIYGIGTDIVRISRVEDALERFGRRFAEKVLGDEELLEFDGYHNPARLLAKRFAVKEATLKALGTGLRMGMSLKDIQLEHDALGKPMLCLSGKAESIARERGVGQGFVSLSDEKEYALAFVTLMQA